MKFECVSLQKNNYYLCIVLSSNIYDNKSKQNLSELP